ncbi:chitobiase/beta-hexosaminidase C-terminal domain-containing protein [Cytobacillus firmus]|uniref:chitobiase/beta-hexosaminidase C-terminal domain-containing protein n=1 Tax=Cytobacillus firmus TaxID=1399 RepID=UPI0021AD5A46|nr:chitobiase/beta-hexosaminidase C-terminal domain-containing protein [Cytobacillus firmus]
MTKKILSLIIAIAFVCSALPVSKFTFAKENVEVVETPTASVPSGRYENTKIVSLSTKTKNADIYYTLDGTLPNKKSEKYKKNKPIIITKTTNLSVIAIKKGVSSKPATFSYIIKTKEKPLLQFVAMSDVHVGSHEKGDARYASFFDTIASIFPQPDAILSVGDMVNDNGDSHKVIKEIFQDNLIRKNMTDTKVQMAIGNHDASVAKMQEHYPAEWFTSQKNGYYETQIGGYYFFFLNGNNYNSDTAQRNWLKGRLAEITSDPKNSNKPIFVTVHQPISNTVMDGQQASNPNLNIDLKDYPQVITLSGHSHLNTNDDRSIYQKDFTSLNLGSMSYIESDHGYQAVTDAGLVGRFEFPVSQALFIEVYKNRVEVERVALNADPGDIYEGGKWSAEPKPPFNSTGVTTGEKWVIELKGRTNEEIKSNFKYIAANRNKVAPQFNKNSKLKVENLDAVPNLTFIQAKDDQMVHHYEVKVTKEKNGFVVKNLKVFSDYMFSPIPDKMNIPLEGLDGQTHYKVEVTAVDSYGNKTSALQKAFKTGGTPPVLTPIDHETMWKELVVDMKFDGNLTDDAKGATGLATSNGSVNYVDGISNKAAFIASGNSNHIDLGDRRDLKFGNGSFTVSFWHTGNLAGDQTVISNKNWSSGGNKGWYIGPSVTNSMTLNLSDGMNRSDIRATAVGNEWHLFTITVDRTNHAGKVYVDGVEKATLDITKLGENSLDTAFNIIIGADGNKGYGGANVTVDDLKIWKRSLSNTEVKALSDSYK